MANRFTLTTPLYYVNDKPHIGSVYTTLATDAVARWQRLQGDAVCFVTGCDEHGLKIQRSATAAGQEPQAYVDRMAATFADLWQRIGISHDRFVRTSAPRHQQVVHSFYERVRRNGHLRMGHQQGWYCVACEEFKDVAADATAPDCSIHQRPLEWRDEENLFFCLSHFQEPILQLLDSKDFVGPASRQQEVHNFVAAGLRDFSISRVNLPWGIPVPDQPGHTFYVWFDALLGYITALQEGDEEEGNLELALASGWPAQLHVIGKDILRFHAVYWPAMLMAADLPLPKRVFGHGFLTREGRKMGKTLGNTLNPETLLERAGMEPVRWYLLRDIHFGDDGDFQQQRFVALVNNDLANTIGNLVNRSVSMARRWFAGAVPPLATPLSGTHSLVAAANRTTRQVEQCFAEQDLQGAACAALQLAIDANGYLNSEAPWKLIKDPTQAARVGSILYGVLEATRILGLCLVPIVPDFANRLLLQLGCEPLESDCSSQPGDWQRQVTWGGLPSGHPLPQEKPLLERLELDGDL